jgi:hypothetical protein
MALAVMLAAMSDPSLPDAISPPLSYAIAVVAIGATLVVGARWSILSEHRGPLWQHPPFLISAYVVGMVAIPGLLIFFDHQTFAPSFIQHEYVARGMVLVLAGVLSLWAGYLVGLARFRPFRWFRHLQDTELSPLVLACFYGTVVGATLLRMAVIGIGYGADTSRWGAAAALDQWVSHLEASRLLILSLVAIHVFRGEWSRRLLITILGFEIVFAFTSGFMKPLLWIVAVLSLSALAAGLKLRRYARYLLPLALACILIVPVSQGIRYSVLLNGFDNGSPSAVMNSTWHVVEDTWHMGTSAQWDSFLGYVGGRLGFVAYMPGLVMSRTPSVIPHLGFERFLETPLYLLPRAIWTDKPVLSRSQWFSVNYLDMPPDTPSGTALTIFGESYLFSGWVTTVLGLFCLGLLLAVVFHNTVAAGLTTVYIAMVPGFIDIESELTTKIISMFQSFLVFMLIYGTLGWISRWLRAR